MDALNEILRAGLLTILFVVICLVTFVVLVLLVSSLINYGFKLKGGCPRDKGDDEGQL